jgi:hypothetical protein
MYDKTPRRVTQDNAGFSIPVEERIRHYYVLGFKSEDIAKCVSNEYQTFELVPIDIDSIRKYIRKNRKSLMSAREEYAMKIREENSLQLQENFLTAQSVEIRMVKTYAKKIEELVEELDSLDISERNADGYFVNMGQYATLVTSINVTHSTLAKLSGTESARSVMEHMRKAYAKEIAAKSSGMHDAAQKMDIVFMDDAAGMKQFGPSSGLPELKKVN